MFLITLSAFAGMFGQVGLAQTDQSRIAASKVLLAQWAPVVVGTYPSRFDPKLTQESSDLDQKFERLNGGRRGSVQILATILDGEDNIARRSAATVLGSLHNGNFDEIQESGAWSSTERALAAKYVLDGDPATARNATDTLILFFDVDELHRMSQFDLKWTNSLKTADGPQAANLAKLFAFTTIPIAGAVPDLYRLYQSRDPETSSWAMCALARAETIDHDELYATAVANTSSKSGSEREAAFRSLETVSAILWDNLAARRWLQTRIAREPYLLSIAWDRATMVDARTGQRQIASKQNPPNPLVIGDGWKEERSSRRKALLQVLENGLGDLSRAVRTSSAKALIQIGRQVDWEMSMGSSWKNPTNKEDVRRLLILASKVAESEDLLVAKQAHDIAVGFDLPRDID